MSDCLLELISALERVEIKSVTEDIVSVEASTYESVSLLWELYSSFPDTPIVLMIAVRILGEVIEEMAWTPLCFRLEEASDEPQ